MKKFLLILSAYFLSIAWASSQPEVYPWGNISGIRVDGELMELNTTLGFVGADWSATEKAILVICLAVLAGLGRKMKQNRDSGSTTA